MATGTYGIVRPADVSPEDIEIWVHYTPNRVSEGNQALFSLDPAQYLIKVNDPNNTTNTFEIMGGLYTLKLPIAQFGQKGIYSIYIRPIQIRTKIIDCGVLSSLPDVKGLVFDLSSIDSRFLSRFENNGLVGYRVEYLTTDTGSNENKIQNFFRVITSNNRAEPVNQNLTNTSQKAIRYRFNDNSTLVFATLSPSAPSNVKPNVLPFIGQPNQDVIITNTFFNPIMLEVEMVDHDIETLAYGIFGNQTKSLEDGIYTIYNFSDQIYKQYNLFEIKDRFTGKPLFEVREERDNIDFTKGLGDITNI
jgi:hypothetical protein